MVGFRLIRFGFCRAQSICLMSSASTLCPSIWDLHVPSPLYYHVQAEKMEPDDIDSDFRHIQLDDTGPFRSLQVDKLFLRAHQWRSQTPHAESSTSRHHRPPSPIRQRAVFPLPLPTDKVESPLGGLFDYPELAPLVLGHFDRPRDFATLGRVCKSWNSITRKKLYEHIWVRPCACVPRLKGIGTDYSRGERMSFQAGSTVSNPP